MVGAKPRGRGIDKRKASPERLACCVDYYDKLSNLSLIEGLVNLQSFLGPKIGKA